MSRLPGRRWQVLSFNASSSRRSRNLAQRASSSSLVAHLRLKYSPSVQLEPHLPPSEARGESDYAAMVTCDQLTGPLCCMIYVVPDSFIASLRSVSPSAAARRHSHPSGRTPWRPRDTWMSTWARRWVNVSGSLQWINHLGHHLHFSSSLDCSTSFPIWLCWILPLAGLESQGNRLKEAESSVYI